MSEKRVSDPPPDDIIQAVCVSVYLHILPFYSIVQLDIDDFQAGRTCHGRTGYIATASSQMGAATYLKIWRTQLGLNNVSFIWIAN